jgi:molybdopterin molybdotransferase
MSAMEKKITIGRSRELLCAHITGLGSEIVSLDQALGRVCQEPILCDRELPPFDRVTMDGIAVCLAGDSSRRQWSIVGTQYAGDPPLELSNNSVCVEIMTGAKLPVGADTVIPVEWIEKAGDFVKLNRDETVEIGQFIHQKGSDSERGRILIEPGTVLNGRHLSLCAAVGKTALSVNRLPVVAFVSTGNELVVADQIPGEVEVRRSNDHAVAAECAKLGIQLSENKHLPDDRAAISICLETLVKQTDIVVFSGGVSMGKADYIPECARECGFEMVFHKVKQKPGGPVLLGIHPSGTILLGLPGNPLSSLVCARLYLREILQRMTGFPLYERKMMVKGPFPKDSLKVRLQPVKLIEHVEYGMVAEVIFPNTSGDMRSVIDSDGIVLIPILDEREDEQILVLEYLDWRI